MCVVVFFYLILIIMWRDGLNARLFCFVLIFWDRKWVKIFTGPACQLPLLTNREVSQSLGWACLLLFLSGDSEIKLILMLPKHSSTRSVKCLAEMTLTLKVWIATTEMWYGGSRLQCRVQSFWFIVSLFHLCCAIENIIYNPGSLVCSANVTSSVVVALTPCHSLNL